MTHRYRESLTYWVGDRKITNTGWDTDWDGGGDQEDDTPEPQPQRTDWTLQAADGTQFYDWDWDAAITYCEDQQLVLRGRGLGIVWSPSINQPPRATKRRVGDTVRYCEKPLVARGMGKARDVRFGT